MPGLTTILSHESGPFWQFVKYGVIGVMATVVQTGVFYALAATCLPCLTADDVAVRFLGLPSATFTGAEAWYVSRGMLAAYATAEYLDDMMTKITLIGGTGLLVVALIPMLLMGWMSIPWAIASFFGGTSLLIIVGVALDTLRIMESHLLVRKYDGFLSHGTLRGRSGI